MSCYTIFGELCIEIPQDYEQIENEDLWVHQLQTIASIIPPGDNLRIWKSSESESTLVLACIDAHLKTSEIESRALGYLALMQRMVPGFLCHEVLKHESDDVCMAVIAYQSHAISHDLYNIFMLATQGYREHIALFSCDASRAFTEVATWSDAFIHVHKTSDKTLQAL